MKMKNGMNTVINSPNQSNAQLPELEQKNLLNSNPG